MVPRLDAEERLHRVLHLTCESIVGLVGLSEMRYEDAKDEGAGDEEEDAVELIWH